MAISICRLRSIAPVARVCQFLRFHGAWVRRGASPVPGGRSLGPGHALSCLLRGGFCWDSTSRGFRALAKSDSSRFVLAKSNLSRFSLAKSKASSFIS